MKRWSKISLHASMQTNKWTDTNLGSHLDAQSTVCEVFAHIVLDLLCPDPPAALLDKLLDAHAALLRRIGAHEARPAQTQRDLVVGPAPLLWLIGRRGGVLCGGAGAPSGGDGSALALILLVLSLTLTLSA